MGGPMSDYRLGRIFHREYEAEVSCYWGRNLGRQKGPGLGKRLQRFLGRIGVGLDRVSCAAIGKGLELSPDGCEVAG
jgi:hypothetical protein